MPYTIAIFPEFDRLEEIKCIIRKYHPNTNELAPHVALVYYFNRRPSMEDIKNIVKNIQPFGIRFNEIRISNNGKYIFLDVSDGKDRIVSLNNLLYDALGLKWKKEFDYEPHITLAKIRNESKREAALEEIKSLSFDVFCEVSSLYLLEMNDDLMTLRSKERIDLG